MLVKCSNFLRFFLYYQIVNVLNGEIILLTSEDWNCEWNLILFLIMCAQVIYSRAYSTDLSGMMITFLQFYDILNQSFVFIFLIIIYLYNSCIKWYFLILMIICDCIFLIKIRFHILGVNCAIYFLIGFFNSNEKWHCVEWQR